MASLRYGPRVLSNSCRGPPRQLCTLNHPACIMILKRSPCAVSSRLYLFLRPAAYSPATLPKSFTHIAEIVGNKKIKAKWYGVIFCIGLPNHRNLRRLLSLKSWKGSYDL
jgi:hypothetical protein